jgi:hypothetical protein
MDLKKHLNPPGSQHLFKTGVNMAIILDVTPNSKVYKGVLEQRKIYDLTENPIENPHLTLHMINFNNKHPLMKKYDILKKMKSISKECYNEILRGTKLVKVDFDLLGKPQDPTYVIKYALNFPESITKFRLCLYDKIAQLIELKDHNSLKGRMVGKTISNKKYFIYSTPDGMPLYGIHEYYHGQSNWEPHISLFKLKEKSLFFKREIGELFFKTKDYKPVIGNKKILLPIMKPFNGSAKLSLNDLILRENNFGRIKISTIGAVKEIEYIGATKKKRKSKRKSRKSRKSRK